MIVKIIKCLLLTILICIGMSMIVMGVKLFVNTLGAAVVMLILFGIVVFSTIFVLVWSTLY